jgi:hypothetical protein
MFPVKLGVSLAGVFCAPTKKPTSVTVRVWVNIPALVQFVPSNE